MKTTRPDFQRSLEGGGGGEDGGGGRATEISPLCPAAPSTNDTNDDDDALVVAAAAAADRNDVPPSAHSTDEPTRLSAAYLYGSLLVGDGTRQEEDDSPGSTTTIHRTPSGGYFETEYAGAGATPHDAPPPPRRSGLPHLPFPSLSRSASHGSIFSIESSPSLKICLELNTGEGWGLESLRRHRRQTRARAVRCAVLAAVTVVIGGAKLIRWWRRTKEEGEP